MKNIVKFISIVSIALACISCNKGGDAGADFGNSVIYIPQATSSGGINNDYNSPDGVAPNTVNYKINGNTVDIFLGVLLSGKAVNQGFSVDVAVDIAKTNAVAQEEGLVPLPVGSYILPSKVDVSPLESSKTFHLTLSKEFILSATEGKYVIAVRISNPTSYTLSTKYDWVSVIVDADKFRELI